MIDVLVLDRRPVIGIRQPVGKINTIFFNDFCLQEYY